MSTPQEPCRTCDGLGFVETAAPDSRVIHHEPCPDCAAPAATPATGTAMTEERAAGRRLWEALHAALGVEGYLDHWWPFPWDDLPADLQSELVDAARRSRQAERDALVQALVQEYACVLERRGPWAEQRTEAGHPGAHALRLAVAGMALQRAAERLGVADLHARAAEVAARSADGEGP